MVRQMRKAEKAQSSAVDDIASYIRGSIAKGSLEPGSKLPSVRKLAELRKVSPNSVNAAMGILEAERLIVRLPQKGVFVRSVSFDPAHPVALVCFLINRVPDENWNVHVGLGAAAALSQKGVPFTIVEPGPGACKDFSELKSFIKSKVPSPGGVILTWAACSEAELRAFSKEIDAPVVKIGRHSRDCASNYVSIDHLEAGRIAASHALGLLDREFLLLSGASMHDFPRRQLLDGFIDRLQEERPPELKVRLLCIPGGEMEDGRAAMQDHLKANPPPGCVFCVGDHLALGAMRGALEAGFKVPEQIAFIGSNGFESSKLSTPSLSHIHQPMEKLGAKAVETLIEAKGQDSHLASGSFIDVSWWSGASV